MINRAYASYFPYVRVFSLFYCALTACLKGSVACNYNSRELSSSLSLTHGKDGIETPTLTRVESNNDFNGLLASKGNEGGPFRKGRRRNDKVGVGDGKKRMMIGRP